MINTAKDVVINSLLNEKYLSIKDIFLKQQKEYKLSYNSIYKAVIQLYADKKLSKSPDGYSIGLDWANQKIQFNSKLMKHLKNMGEFSGIGTSIHKFNDIRKMYKFLRKLEENHLELFEKNKRGSIIWAVYHYYNYLLQPAAELHYL